MPVQTYSPAMKTLMLAIGRRMSDNPEKWIESAWISSASSLYDFCLDDHELEDIIHECNIKPVRGMNLGELADSIQELPAPLVFGKN